MNTQLLSSAQAAALLLQEGRLVAFPTETVFGLGADATNGQTIQRLFEAKGRPSNNPLIVHLAEVEQWPLAAARLTRSAEILLQHFSPGPLTVVLPKQAAIDDQVTAGLDTVGIRIPAEPTARKLLHHAGIPIAAPSANQSGRPSCTRWQSVLEDMEGRIDAILCHNTQRIGLESTVVDCSGDIPVVLRPGAISLHDIQQLIPSARKRQPDDGAINSPGLLHPHYQPRAKLHLCQDSTQARQLAAQQAGCSCLCGLAPLPRVDGILHAREFLDIADYAAGFYEFLREADRLQAVHIFAQRSPPDSGLGLALLDRQERAAGLQD